MDLNKCMIGSSLLCIMAYLLISLSPLPLLSLIGCGICEKCTYPDAPCRFPDRAFPSMEACGLVVNDVCKASGIPYNYGPRTMTFTGCVLYMN